MEIRLKTGSKNQIISILNTYAPHMWYQTEHINTYWTTLNQYIDTIPNTYIRMWCTDNDGQITKPPDNNANNIGHWTLTNKTDKGDGAKLIQTCLKHDYICANTHKIPKNNNKANLATWYCPTQTNDRQIDFFLISKQHGNCVKKSKTTK